MTADRPNRRIVASEHFDGLRNRSRAATSVLTSLGVADLVGRLAASTRRQLVKAYSDGLAIPMFSADAIHGDPRDGGYMSNVAKLDADMTLTGLPGCSMRSTMLGSLAEIGPHADVVIAVGSVETLTAACRFEDAVVLGAQDVTHLEQIAASAAPRTRLAGRRLHLVVPDCNAGIAACTDIARDAIQRLGLELHRRLIIVQTEPYSTLNDLHRATPAKRRAR